MTVLFAGIDRAAFAGAFLDRLRSVGLDVALGDGEALVRALAVAGPMATDDLYWICRVSLVKRREDVAVFDREFSRVFDTGHGPETTELVQTASPEPASNDANHRVRTLVDGMAVHGAGLPWNTPYPSLDPDDQSDDGDDSSVELPEPAPSAEELLASIPFDRLDPVQLAEVNQRIEAMVNRWPMRSSRRRRPANHGAIDLRTTLASARRTGGDPFVLGRTTPGLRPRRVVALVDVSGSMKSFAQTYLHLLRAMSRAGRAEAFVFSTGLTRLTTILSRRSVSEAMAKADQAVVDRFGGTRIAESLGLLLGHRVWGSMVRGAVVLVVSDGWETDDPALLGKKVAALARRSHRLIWVNPRSGGPGYRLEVGGMRAAQPHCDVVLSGHTLQALDEVFLAIEQADGQRGGQWRRRPC